MFSDRNFIPSLIAFPQPAIHSFEQIDSLQKTDPRNIIIFIHTDWCRFCLEMQNKTFKDVQIVKLLNEKFWFIRLNVEKKREIVFSGTVFKYKPNGYQTGIHELAEH